MQTDKAKANQENKEQSKEDLQKQLLEAQTAIKALQEKEDAEATNKAAVDEAASKKADEDKKAQLAAKADIKALLSDNGDEKKEKKGVEDLSNQELLNIMGGAVEKALAASIERSGMDSDEKLKGLSGTVDSIKQLLMNMRARKLVDETRAKYKDFGDFQDDVIELVTKIYPGMSPEHAYMIAKSTKGAEGDTRNKMETERPTGGMPPAGETRERKVPDEKLRAMTPRRRFDSLLNDAVDKHLAGRKES